MNVTVNATGGAGGTSQSLSSGGAGGTGLLAGQGAYANANGNGSAALTVNVTGGAGGAALAGGAGGNGGTGSLGSTGAFGPTAYASGSGPATLILNLTGGNGGSATGGGLGGTGGATSEAAFYPTAQATGGTATLILNETGGAGAHILQVLERAAPAEALRAWASVSSSPHQPAAERSTRRRTTSPAGGLRPRRRRCRWSGRRFKTDRRDLGTFPGQLQRRYRQRHCQHHLDLDRRRRRR